MERVEKSDVPKYVGDLIVHKVLMSKEFKEYVEKLEERITELEKKWHD